MARKKLAAVSAVLPAGFRSVAGGADGKAWQPEVGDTLTGRVMGKKTIDAKKAGRQKAKKGETVTIVTVADENGELHAVWESHALAQFCREAKPGDRVFLRLNEIKKSGKKRFKDFTAGIAAKK